MDPPCGVRAFRVRPRHASLPCPKFKAVRGRQSAAGRGTVEGPARQLITVEDLRKSFGHAEALRGISFSVTPSSLVVIIGPSGCGKSTLLRCLNGLELLDSGRVRIGGVTLERHDGQFPRDLKTRLRGLRREVGMVFQSFNLFPHMTVLENVVKAPVAVKGMSRAQAE